MGCAASTAHASSVILGLSHHPIDRWTHAPAIDRSTLLIETTPRAYWRRIPLSRRSSALCVRGRKGRAGQGAGMKGCVR